MYKTLSDARIFVLVYLILMLPTYLADTGITGTDSMLYLLSMVGIFGICLIRGRIIGKNWLIFVSVAAFGLDLIPALSSIAFTSYLYHALAMVVGVACPVVAVKTSTAG